MCLKLALSGHSNNGCAANPATFGIDLRLAVAKGEQPIPIIVGLCLNTLAQHFEIEGLFRVTGSNADVEALKVQFDNGASPPECARVSVS